jgi:dTDP-4-amino-4,6-dideoxygalactose transaminase/serine acetyltransferase
MVEGRPLPGVPFLDLVSSHAPLKAAVLADVAELIDSGAFTNGPQVAEFERAFADYCGTKHCAGTASGLDALRLALIAAGAQPEDEVILPAHTFAATLEAVIQARAKPVLVDVSERDYNIDPAAVEAAVTPRTRFLLPVHLYGQLADMSALTKIARGHRLAIVEDACQAHGAERDGFRAGTGGLAGCFSFYPGKNLGAFGDAGACVTNDEELAAHVRALREHGQRRKYFHDFEGYTSRLDTIQAIVLLRKLPLLAGWNEERCAAALYYSQALDGVGDLVLPPVPEGSSPVWHLYVVRTAEPMELSGFLRERGVGCGHHYPIPLHLLPAYERLGYETGSFPVTERLAAEAISLPIFPGIVEAQLEAASEAVGDVEFGENVVVQAFTNLYGCKIGDNTRIGPFVEIQRGAVIGANCKIQSHSFICDGVTIEDEVFVGHGVVFINDRYPRATNAEGELRGEEDWELLTTVVERDASLGSGAVIIGGIQIGAGAIIGAGAVVTKNVLLGSIVAGNPATPALG